MLGPEEEAPPSSVFFVTILLRITLSINKKCCEWCCDGQQQGNSQKVWQRWWTGTWNHGLARTNGYALAIRSRCNRGHPTSSSNASLFWLKTGQSCDDVIGLVPVDGAFRLEWMRITGKWWGFRSKLLVLVCRYSSTNVCLDVHKWHQTGYNSSSLQLVKWPMRWSYLLSIEEWWQKFRVLL